MKTNLQPAPGYMIVKLGEYYEGIKMPESKYDSKTEGVALKVNPKDSKQSWSSELVGKRVYWGEYREGKRVTFEGTQMANIRIEDIEAWEA